MKLRGVAQQTPASWRSVLSPRSIERYVAAAAAQRDVGRERESAEAMSERARER